MFLRKLLVRKGSVAALISSFVLSTSPQALAAPVVHFGTLGTSCNTTYSNAFIQGNRYIATRDLNITAINYLIGTQSSTNFSTSFLYIFSDNAASNVPGAILETFTPGTLNGAGSATYGRFLGSKAISSGTKFWIVPSVQASVLPWCNWSAVTTANITLNGVIPDTSTSNSNSSFLRAYSSATTPPNSGTWLGSGNASFLWQLSIEGASPVMTISLGLQNGGNKAIYRTSSTINANVNTSSKVTFYSKSKVIPNCRNILSVSGVATCSWSPSLIGVNSITARSVPLDSNYSNGTAQGLEVLVSARTNKR